MVLMVLLAIAGVCIIIFTRAASTLKPPIEGMLDRQGFPKSDYTGVVKNYVINVDWSDIQPNSAADFNTATIDSAVSKAASSGMRLKIRFFAGSHSPQWVKQLAGGPVNYYEPVDQNADSYAIPRFWTNEVASAYNGVQGKLAAKYDSVAQIGEITINRCMTVYAEPMIRGIVDSRNLTSLSDAGYTTALDQQCQREQIDSHQVWQKTRSSVAFNPYQVIVKKTDGTYSGKTDNAFTLSMMDYCRSSLGARCVLENNSIRSTNMGADYDAIYNKMKAMGGPITLQTATPARIGDWRATLGWAANTIKANAVELNSGYASYPVGELSQYNNAMLANPYLDNIAPADTTPPTANISQPSAESNVSNTTGVVVSASDNTGGSGLAKVELYIDGDMVQSSVTSPLNYNWNTNGLTNGTHVLSARSYDTAGNIGNSQSVSVNINNPDLTPPTTPANLKITSSSYSQVVLSWSASTDNVGVNKYVLKRNGTIINNDLSTTSYMDQSVSPSTSYSYVALAQDAAGNLSAPSNQVLLTTAGLPAAAPKTPAGLSTSAKNQMVHLSWRPNSETNIKQYGVRYRKAGETAWIWIGYSTTTSYDFSETADGVAPANGTTYEFSIRARNSGDLTSAWTDENGGTAVSAKPLPAAPTNLLGSVTKNNIGVNWTPPADLKTGDGYVLKLNSSLSVKTASTNYAFSGLKPCTTYTVKASSIDVAGNLSAGSVERTFTTAGTKFMWWCL